MSDDQSRDRIDEARTILLRALDDLDQAREEGRTLTDFVICMVAESDDDEDATHAYTGLSVPGSVRLGTWAYFHESCRAWLYREHFNDDG